VIITADVFPLDVRYLNHRFSQTGRVALTHRKFEVFLANRHLFKNLRVDFVVVDVKQVHFLTDTLQSSFGAQLGHVRSDETMRFFRNSGQVHVLAQLHVFCVNAQDLKASDFIRHT
jgi:hypothetical protein